jgi:hypothetical protein
LSEVEINFPYIGNPKYILLNAVPDLVDPQYLSPLETGIGPTTSEDDEDFELEDGTAHSTLHYASLPPESSRVGDIKYAS